VYWNSVASKTGRPESPTVMAAATWARRLPPRSREHAQADEREAEEAEADALKERRERRVGDKAPVEVARVREELQLVAMESVAVIGQDVGEREGGGDGGEDKCVRAAGVGRGRSCLVWLAGGEGKHGPPGCQEWVR
jgi:hypothetical protein